MLKAYLAYIEKGIPTIRIDTHYEGEAKEWADKLCKLHITVFVGKYSIRTAKWRWFYYETNKRINFKDTQYKQPPEYIKPHHI